MAKHIVLLYSNGIKAYTYASQALIKAHVLEDKKSLHGFIVFPDYKSAKKYSINRIAL